MPIEKLKIVMLLSRIDQSGLTKNTIDLAEGLTDLGHEILLITGGISEVEQSERVFVFYKMLLEMGVEIKTFKKPSGSLFRKGYNGISGLLNILGIIRKYNPNVIHAQSPYMTFIPWLLGEKFTTTIHQMNLKRTVFFKTPVHIIAISEESKADSIKNYGISENKVTIIHHGVPLRYSQSITNDDKMDFKKKLDIPEDKIILGSVGNLSRRKGVDITITALKELNDEVKNLIHFVFLGDDKDCENAKLLLRSVELAGLSNIVTHVPFEDPKPYYDIMDIFVLSSRQESFPLVTLEAMMSGCCTVRSNTEGAYEQIIDGETGFLFENENYLELRDILVKVIVNRELRVNLAKNARNYAMKFFTIKKMTENTLNIYEKIKIH